MVGCHTSKQWVIQNSIPKHVNHGLQNCTQHKKVRIMIDLFTLKPLHLWPVSPGGWLRNRKHASSTLFSFETRRRRSKLLCRVKEIRWLWTVSRLLHMTSRGHLKKDLVQTDELYLSQFQVCPATMTNATFEEFKGKDSLFVSEWLRQNGLEKPLRGIWQLI